MKHNALPVFQVSQKKRMEIFCSGCFAGRFRFLNSGNWMFGFGLNKRISDWESLKGPFGLYTHISSWWSRRSRRPLSRQRQRYWYWIMFCNDDWGNTEKKALSFYLERNRYSLENYYSFDCNPNSHSLQTHTFVCTIFLQQHEELPNVRYHCTFFHSAARKNICFLLKDIKLDLRAFFSVTKMPGLLKFVQAIAYGKTEKERLPLL